MIQVQMQKEQDTVTQEIMCLKNFLGGKVRKREISSQQSQEIIHTIYAWKRLILQSSLKYKKWLSSGLAAL